MLNLTDAQKREQAIQRAIEATFTIPGHERAEALLQALARVIRAGNRGRNLSDDAAGSHAQLLLEVLTGEPAESWDIYRKEFDDENV